MRAALLLDRGVVKVAGEDARKFLNGLLTADIGEVGPGAARYAALLTPQGKILVDCLVVGAPGEPDLLYLDCPRALAPELVQRLTFYRLRAKVKIDDLTDQLVVLALWEGAGTTPHGVAFADPRLASLGWRVLLTPDLVPEVIAEAGAEQAEPSAYDTHRIALGVPRGGSDFIYGDAYPHETDMDQLGGVDFDKGCYVGQEVVSRIEHRSRARSRIVPVAFEDFVPEPGVPVMAGDKQVGMLGSTAAGRGLALLRLDRVEEALAKGAELSAGGLSLRLVKPAWARFAFPGESTSAA